MLTRQQSELLTLAQSVIRREIEAGKYLPCFGLLSNSQGQTMEFVPNCEPGQEKQLFAEIVSNLKSGIAAGGTCTAVITTLEPSTDESSGATIDLEQRGEQRMIGFLEYFKGGAEVKFQEPIFTAKPSVLFREA